jgi:hypothetical protein
LSWNGLIKAYLELGDVDSDGDDDWLLRLEGEVVSGSLVSII